MIRPRYEPTRAPTAISATSVAARLSATPLCNFAASFCQQFYVCHASTKSAWPQNSGNKDTSTAPLSRLQVKNIQLHTYRKKSHMKAHIRRNTAKWGFYLLNIPLISFADKSAATFFCNKEVRYGKVSLL
jgi:hypothetical protein